MDAHHIQLSCFRDALAKFRVVAVASISQYPSRGDLPVSGGANLLQGNFGIGLEADFFGTLVTFRRSLSTSKFPAGKVAMEWADLLSTC
jgi:hypothetical protein